MHSSSNRSDLTENFKITTHQSHFYNWTGTSGMHVHRLARNQPFFHFSSWVWCPRISGVGWVGYSDPGILAIAKKPTPYYKREEVSYASRLRFQDILSFITGCNPGIKLVHIFRIQLGGGLYYWFLYFVLPN